MLLSDLVDAYCTAVRNNSYAKSTVRLRSRTARYFLAHVGNIQAHNVTATHVDNYFAARAAANVKESTLNLELGLLRDFWKFATRYKPAGVKHDPFWHRRNYRVMPRSRQRVNVIDFDRLLDSAAHPRDRALLALGLFTMLRQSEIVTIRIGDLDLQAGYIKDVQIIKSAKRDDVPISAELDREMRRWLTAYTEECGPLQPDYYLVPAKTAPQLIGRGISDPGTVRLRPARRLGHPERIVQTALLACGYVTEDEDGTTREGVHTLRRSAARALFDTLSDAGHDQALRVVQSALHHSSQTTTERYLGVEVDKRKRDDIIRGKAMFGVKGENVVELKKRRAEP